MILLSGTPALNRPAELFTQIKCVAPQLFKSFNEFGNRYCDPQVPFWAKRKGRYMVTFLGATHMLELSVLLSETVMIRHAASIFLPFSLGSRLSGSATQCGCCS